MSVMCKVEKVIFICVFSIEIEVALLLARSLLDRFSVFSSLCFGAELDKHIAKTSIRNQVDFWSDLLWIWGSIWEAFGREKGGKKVAKKRDEKKRATSGHAHPSGDFKGIHFRAPGPAGG